MQNQTSYYGGFYWIAITSFIVPLFVAYAAFTKLSPTTKPTPRPDVSGVDNNLWDYLLRTYVENGLVDYNGISKDYLFTTYLRQIAGADPTKLESAADRLALHCNAYNALVIHGVVNHKIHLHEKNVLNFTPKEVAAQLAKLDKEIEALKRNPNSDANAIAALMNRADKIRRDSQFFRIKEHVFANQTISLDHLEQELIRPVFNEPRIHVALVCAAKSCPAIRPEAYVGKRLEEQLADQARQFANNLSYVDYDPVSNAVKLSPILKWYAEDWKASGGYLQWIAAHLDEGRLRDHVFAASEGKANVAFNSYDWTLNAQAGAGGSVGAKGGGGFGSGSVPNE